ncbi:MAG: Elongation factor 4 [Candidatus Uhrbacteria bacterium GW2011_GWE2_40_58]|nr:MAG: Elongation factor 4 [Candidatus Uhrbacteria bacterium GW2011_GWF2_40_263]KKR67955.1 MAG: Elongation factor 4 [Candidatus Uhrbacteria bacterium GW2011_GWE2_40_58]OGL92401.1 MAG: elongation factor 4 [Candidatus Uhrbacteria bacterium RIFOXYA2_FULL_40_9]OGL96992.1 MAG: elongation factor 4 [Candidatus Uhrbacteria bacterium RIFOXYB2_FULL_41_18]HBK34770.1 elongation factor 4 [Candidatus Uhrbacteria bacterium]
MNQSSIRNFCIIAHIDHGKSTLSDRMLEVTGTVEKRKMKEQILDSMELEREKGITIKLAPARMHYKNHVLNLIDTPGHVDFNYEVSRSLAAVEGAVLLVDATQGVQAQTIGNLYLALEEDLTIIPVLNKIDLPAADVPKRTEEIVKLIGCDPSEVLSVSGKTGEGVEALLEAIIERIPHPKGQVETALRALIFDSAYDDYKGVVSYVRVVDGQIKKGDRVKMMATRADGEVLEVGALTPQGFIPAPILENGQIGYLVTGLKDITSCRVGDTVTNLSHSSKEPLPGYRVVKPMVFAGIFPEEGDDFQRLREAMDRLKLSDSSLTFEPEHSPALGYGFRCGLLGMLHLEILKERLEREFDFHLVVTVPSVGYHVFKKGDVQLLIKSPLELPDPSFVERIEEPWVKADIVTPNAYIGAVMQLVQDRRGLYKNTEYLSENRVILHYEIPLAMVIVDFYDKLKSVTAGYASLNYEVKDYREADVVRMDILVAEEPVEAFALLVYRDEADRIGRRIVSTLKDSIPRQWFVIKLQAAVGGKIVASERLSALRKDVTAKLYGGDVTRKRKLLQKQKKGKARMAEMGKGKVQIPTSTYLKVLKR